jgi:L-lactate dehydrogenase
MTTSATGAAKIAIVGAGHVGVTLAYACMIRGTGKTIALYDSNAEKVRAEVLDLQHGLQFVPMATVTGSDDIEVCRDADVLVLTVGGYPKAGQSRLEMARSSVATSRDLLPRLLDVAPGAVVVIVTNPVDVVTYAALKILGLPRNQVVGSGTILDSSRLRSMISQRCGVAVQSAHAYIVGEHRGDQLPEQAGTIRNCRR